MPVCRLRKAIDLDRRDLLNQLGSELAGILQDASATATLLPRVADQHCPEAVEELRQAVASAEALLAAMQALAAPKRSKP